MKILRLYRNLEAYLKPNKVLVIYGPRQVGKTTLLNDFLSQTHYKYRLEGGENVKVQEIFQSQNFDTLKEFARGNELIVIDEAQKIRGIGLGLKILVDQVPGIRVIVTGSSSFELAGQVGEPLTGRKTTLTLFPISHLEIDKTPFELEEKLQEYLIYGKYPEVVTATSRQEKQDLVNDLAESYLLKDILELEKVKSSKVLLDLLRLLAFQIGSEVSLSELGSQVGLDYKTVRRYIDLFEKAFVIYPLEGFSGPNQRKHIAKKSKYYFYDNGIRNAVINSFNGLSLRDDVGKLWENFLVTERFKKQAYRKIYANNYFWRSKNQQEIDWVEERGGELHGYEFKWGDKTAKEPKQWKQENPKANFTIITPKNYLDFIR